VKVKPARTARNVETTYTVDVTLGDLRRSGLLAHVPENARLATLSNPAVSGGIAEDTSTVCRLSYKLMADSVMRDEEEER
jgi:hypothetical protein